LKPMCCRTARFALLLFTLNKKLASPVSRRDALNAELASLAQKSMKHSGQPRGPGGQGRRYQSSHRELHRHPCALSSTNIDVVLPFVEPGYAKTEVPEELVVVGRENALPDERIG
jgi:hypothetical protein